MRMAQRQRLNVGTRAWRAALAGLAFVVSLGLASGAWAAQRVALVVGVSKYDKVPSLNNPARDAKLVQTTLQKLGFTVKVLTDHRGDIGYERLTSDRAVAKVSVVGVGMRSHAGVATQMFTALSQNSINIQMISTSEIKISVVIDEKYTELAVRVMHESFGLAG